MIKVYYDACNKYVDYNEKEFFELYNLGNVKIDIENLDYVNISDLPRAEDSILEFIFNDSERLVFSRTCPFSNYYEKIY